MTATRRDQVRAATLEEIKAVARQQMAASGTADLSLRAVARSMGLTAPALYRYYPNRDALVTALIVDAFNALADHLEAAQAVATGNFGERFMAVIAAYRGWALAHPVDFQLIYGNPIIGYEAPREETVPAASRNLAILAELLAEGLAEGKVEQPRVPAWFVQHLETLRGPGRQSAPIEALYLSVVGWMPLHGILMLELFNHLQPVVGQTDAFFAHTMCHLYTQMGLNLSE
ncbi:MAG: TetR/AcrR family transcriptional regulator [Anaerolineae bacterium]|nr:TetR/AcrR family transcriptional regulator [Anaerolineae bacterium]